MRQRTGHLATPRQQMEAVKESLERVSPLREPTLYDHLFEAHLTLLRLALDDHRAVREAEREAERHAGEGVAAELIALWGGPPSVACGEQVSG